LDFLLTTKTLLSFMQRRCGARCSRPRSRAIRKIRSIRSIRVPQSEEAHHAGLSNAWALMTARCSPNARSVPELPPDTVREQLPRLRVARYDLVDGRIDAIDRMEEDHGIDDPHFDASNQHVAEHGERRVVVERLVGRGRRKEHVLAELVRDRAAKSEVAAGEPAQPLRVE